MNMREVLTTARATLFDRGWCQGAAIDEKGRVCLGRAIYEAADSGSYDTVIQFILPGSDRDAVPFWNDRLGRTFAEVIALIDNAIGRLPYERPDRPSEVCVGYRLLDFPGEYTVTTSVKIPTEQQETVTV